MLNTTQQNVLSTLVAEGAAYADAYVAALGVGSATPFDEAVRIARVSLHPPRQVFPTDPTDYGFLHTGFLKVRAAAASAASVYTYAATPSGTGTD